MKRNYKPVKELFNKMNKNYSRSWNTAAKQNISRFELDFIHKNIKRLLRRKRILKVLEIGAGTGRITEQLLNYNIQYYGVDISDKMLSIVKKKFGGDTKVKDLKICDISIKEPFKGVKFDLIVVWRVLYYCQNWREIIDKFITKLNKKGMIIYCMPNLYSSALLGKLLVLRSPIHGYFTTKKEITNIMVKNNMSDVSIQGYARLLDVMYDCSSSDIWAKIMNDCEKLFSLILGKTLFVRMFYISGIKSV